MGRQQFGRWVRDAAGQTSRRGWNELAFVPVDYRDGAPADEWSGDRGVGVQYFSQQAVGTPAGAGGQVELPASMPLPAFLEQVQQLMAAGDARARAIYQTIGVYFGYAIATYADFYEFRNLLVLGRVLTGNGGDLILSTAREVLRAEFPEMAERVRYHIPGEREKRHGQAIAAASLPAISHQEKHDRAISPIPSPIFSYPTIPRARSALRRTTHMCICAHQDDIEIMAYHGVAECFGRHDRWFAGSGGDQRSGQSAIGHLCGFHRRRNAKSARAGAAQGGVRG